MRDVDALRLVLLVLTALFLAALIFIGAHGVWLVVFRKWSDVRLAEGRTIIADIVSAPTLEQAAVDRLRGLPRRIQRRLLIELSRNLGGSMLDRTQALADALGLIEFAEEMSRSPWWWKRLHAARILTALDPEEAAVLPFFHDPHPAVRSQAAEWAGKHPTPTVVRTLLALLDDPAMRGRFTVKDSLLRGGLAAAEPLAEFLSSRSGPATVPALEVAAALAQPSFAAPALRLCRDPDAEVRARAADVLGALHSAEGTGMLVQLLDDPDDQVRAAAVRAIGRIAHWPSAPALARRLRDPSFEVRRAAGLGLRSLGSPGLLLLRRYRDDEDRYAADMARQVLDLPETVEVGG